MQSTGLLDILATNMERRWVMVDSRRKIAREKLARLLDQQGAIKLDIKRLTSFLEVLDDIEAEMPMDDGEHSQEDVPTNGTDATPGTLREWIEAALTVMGRPLRARDIANYMERRGHVASGKLALNQQISSEIPRILRKKNNRIRKVQKGLYHMRPESTEVSTEE